MVIDEETPEIHKSLNPTYENADHGFREDVDISLIFLFEEFNKLRVFFEFIQSLFKFKTKSAV